MTEDNRRPGEADSHDEHTRPLFPPPSDAASTDRPQPGTSQAPGVAPGQVGPPAGDQPVAGHHPSTAPTEDTRRFDEPPIWAGAPYAAPAAVATAPPRERGRKRLVAGVLVAALVVGGAAGVGGAAAYDALNGDGPAATRTAPTEFEATKTSVVEDGTVESVADAVLPSVVKVNVVGQEGAGSGSGIVLSEDGEILTNNHVVEGAEGDGAISVSFNDGTTARATVVGTDPLVDIAVIRAEGVSDLTPASIGQSDDLKVGQSVVAIGSPFGLDATVTSGIVSALNRPVSVGSQPQQPDPFGQQQGQTASQSTTYPAVQTDAAINPGNSGGPLVDMSGRVVGINSSIRTASESSGQSGSIGLGFAIPIDEVLPIVNQIVAGDTPTHARLGVSVGEPEATIDNPAPGALVSQVEPSGAAGEAGLQEGDVITKVDDQVIEGPDSLVATIRGHRPGDEVTLTYQRDGDTRTTTATLASDEGTSTS
ncbi:S1C family serine protease [Nocardioides aequoreus]|uniref:S1C family serine protease n=1 Tax=Nocardioides aequoreus TaxID=397278 RepID=UPI000A00F86B|nr:trypsin-like peptidase domain-containing protein [Nocardioides aequoreus]